MCGSSKSNKAQQTAAQSAADAERKAAEENLAAGLEAQKKIIEAGQQTPAETERLSRYTTAAKTPGETLLQQAGPISQAVARRIQERIDQPGLDYDTNQAAFTEGVTNPLWRALKARGIVPPPGAEGGGGLATQQYMKGAEPALASLRSAQINTDITRGQEYGQSATELNKYYQELENTLSEAIRNRQVQTTEAGVPYGVQGTQLKGQGMTAAEAINQAEVQSRYAQKAEDKTAIGKSIGTALALALAIPTGGASLMTIPAIQGVGSTGTTTAKTATKTTQPSSIDMLLQRRATQAINV
jgi:hypothetical protein